VTDKGYHGMTCYGGTADMAIIRELFINTIEAARLVGEESEFINDLAKALPRLHPYTIGQEGDLNEWYYDWRDYDPHHRHQSHLIGLYPGCHLTTDKYEALTTLSTLKEALEKTLIQKGDQTTGWSTGWRINLWARLHKGNEAFHIYQKLLTYVSPDNYRGPDRQRPGGGTYPNLFDAHPPFQIDGNFGGTAGVCEMLIQSTDEITLLPALPSAWPNGEVSGLCARGGFEVSMRWRNGKVEEAQISSKRGGIATVRYNGKMIKITLKPGKTKTIHG
jgi:alpha-L-fucosidase 2